MAGSRFPGVETEKMRNLTPEECEFIAGGKVQKLQAMSYTPEGDRARSL